MQVAHLITAFYIHIALSCVCVHATQDVIVPVLLLSLALQG